MAYKDLHAFILVYLPNIILQLQFIIYFNIDYLIRKILLITNHNNTVNIYWMVATRQIVLSPLNKLSHLVLLPILWGKYCTVFIPIFR